MRLTQEEEVIRLLKREGFIVTFLQPLGENAPAMDLKRFSFDKSRDILAAFTGELSAVVVDDRRIAL